MESVYNSKRGIYYLKFIVAVTHYMICLNSKSRILPADGDRKNQSYIKADTHWNHFQLTSLLEPLEQQTLQGLHL